MRVAWGRVIRCFWFRFQHEFQYFPTSRREKAHVSNPYPAPYKINQFILNPDRLPPSVVHAVSLMYFASPHIVQMIVICFNLLMQNIRTGRNTRIKHPKRYFRTRRQANTLEWIAGARHETAEKLRMRKIVLQFGSTYKRMCLLKHFLGMRVRPLCIQQVNNPNLLCTEQIAGQNCYVFWLYFGYHCVYLPPFSLAGFASLAGRVHLSREYRVWLRVRLRV